MAWKARRQDQIAGRRTHYFCWGVARPVDEWIDCVATAAGSVTSPGHLSNVVAGVIAAGGACYAQLWAWRSCLAVLPGEIVVRGPLHVRRIPRAEIERVWAYGSGYLRIRYTVEGETRTLSTGVTQGYLGVNLFGRQTWSVLAAKRINDLLGIPD